MLRKAALLGVIVTAALAGWSGCAGPKRLPPVAGTQPGPPPARAGAPHLVGVGLTENESILEMTAAGDCLLLDGASGKRLQRLSAPVRLSCRRDAGQVSWSAAGRRGRSGSVVLQPVDPRHRLAFREGEYRGDLLVLPSPEGPGLTLVNNVDLEDYLRGVVPWEIGRHQRDKLAALAAQAVAARTYTISHRGARADHGFDVFASVMDQVYRGSRDEDPLCNEAIELTRGLVLRSGGDEIECYYSACCGGTTSNIQEVWPLAARPYLVSHADAPSSGSEPYCASYRYYDWREEWTSGQLDAILARTLPEYLEYAAEGSRSAWTGPVFRPAQPGVSGAVPGPLRDLEILERTTSGRIAMLAVRTAAGEYIVRGDRVRWVLAPASGQPAILRSARFEVELAWRDGRLTRVAARGKGYGHGIGLCQAGALEMAARGKSYREILDHYYPGAALQSVGDGR